MTLAKPDYCRPCQIFGNGCGFIQPTGSNRVPLMLVGEGGGGTEEKQGKPFVGAAGQVLERAIRTSGLRRDDYTITNLLSCRPPGNLLLKMPYERPALDHCRKYLNDVVAERRPRIMLALGEIPLRELTGGKHSQSSARGYVLDSIYPDVKVIGTFHPSRILRGDWHLFPVLMHDLRVAELYTRSGVPKPLPTAYILQPTRDDLTAYLDRLHSDPSLPVSVDIETASIIGEPEPKSWKLKRIIQIQFSSAVGEALVVPFTDEFRDLIAAVLATPNPKLGWNSRLSDEIALRASGFTLGGEFYDAMLMLSHLQPSFSSGRDASEDEDKKVPAKLLNLQSAVSFYYPYEPVWKGTVRAPGPGLGGWLALWSCLRYYGARDADLTFRIGTRLMQTLRDQGLWGGYYRYKHQLGKVLTSISDRGLPIDRTAQRKLRQRIEWHEVLIERELRQMIPAAVCSVKSYKGWPKDLREAVKEAGLYVKNCKPEQFPEFVTRCGYEFSGNLIRRLPFNADSPKQVMRYIEHQVDAVGSPWFIPLDIDTKKPTTNKAGMEALIAATNDSGLIQIRKRKKIGDLKSYCQGSWVPDADERVHAEFRVGATATGQTSAIDPPIQTYPKHVDPADEWLVPLVKRIKSIVKAEPGHMMVECDARGFHARVQGFLAGDADYYRLADSDLHSYNTAHYLKLPDAGNLLKLDDAALRRRLKEIKAAHTHERNFILKRIAFLRQFHGGADKAATIMKVPLPEVWEIFAMMDELFKPTFKDFPAWVEKQISHNPRLTSAFGCIRYFWDQDLQQATAFLPSNSAHCHIQDALIRLHEQGALDKYQAVDFVHDAAWFHCPIELVDECISVVKSEFERESEVLVSEKLGKFFVHADASIGPSMGELRDA